MPKVFLKGLGVLGLGILFAGCAATKDVKFQAYIEDKPRVDQEIQGNFGYLMGTPKAQALKKPTRQVIVMEFTKESKQGEDVESTGASSTLNATSQVEPRSSSKNEPASDTSPKIVIPDMGTVPVSPAVGKEDVSKVPAEVTYVDYKVEKDDTLQKIAKKFYDNYGKWIKIYNANKEILKNPDHLKPGMMLKIPVEKK